MPDIPTQPEAEQPESGDKVRAFLVKLATDPRELGQFIKDPEATMNSAGLGADDQAVLKSGNQAAINSRLAGRTMAKAAPVTLLVVDIGADGKPSIREGHPVGGLCPLQHLFYAYPLQHLYGYPPQGPSAIPLHHLFYAYPAYPLQHLYGYPQQEPSAYPLQHLYGYPQQGPSAIPLHHLFYAYPLQHLYGYPQQEPSAYPLQHLYGYPQQQRMFSPPPQGSSPVPLMAFYTHNFPVYPPSAVPPSYYPYSQ